MMSLDEIITQLQQFREKEQKQQLQFMMQMGELLKKQISPAEK